MCTLVLREFEQLAQGHTAASDECQGQNSNAACLAQGPPMLCPLCLTALGLQLIACCFLLLVTVLSCNSFISLNRT